MGKDRNKNNIDQVEELSEYIYNISVIPPEIHQFGVNVKLSLSQPGDKNIGHGPESNLDI